MNIGRSVLTLGFLTLIAGAAAQNAAPAGGPTREFRYQAAANTSVSIVNTAGNVLVRAVPGRQVVISAAPQSDRLEIDSSQNSTRIQARTHALDRSAAQARVDYNVQVPADVNLDVRTATGTIRVEGVRGNTRIEGDAAEIHVAQAAGTVSVRSVSGPVTLSDVKAIVDITSPGGEVRLTNVSGARVVVNTTTAPIYFAGDFAGGGDYQLTNHSGTIEVIAPASASLDLTARSVNGSVETDFPFQQKDHTGFMPAPGKSFAGTANKGSSSVELRSFSGRIRVKKQ